MAKRLTLVPLGPVGSTAAATAPALALQLSLMRRSELMINVDKIRRELQHFATRYVTEYNTKRSTLSDSRAWSSFLSKAEPLVESIREYLQGKRSSYVSTLGAFNDLVSFQFDFALLHREDVLQLSRLRKEFTERGLDVDQDRLSPQDQTEIRTVFTQARRLLANTHAINTVLRSAVNSVSATANMRALITEEILQRLEGIRLIPSAVEYIIDDYIHKKDSYNMGYNGMLEILESRARDEILSDYDSSSSLDQIALLKARNRRYYPNTPRDTVEEYMDFQWDIYKRSNPPRFQPMRMISRLEEDARDPSLLPADRMYSIQLAADLQSELQRILEPRGFFTRTFPNNVDTLPVQFQVEELLTSDLDLVLTRKGRMGETGRGGEKDEESSSVMDDNEQSESLEEYDEEEDEREAQLDRLRHPELYAEEENDNVLEDVIDDEVNLLEMEARQAWKRLQEKEEEEAELDVEEEEDRGENGNDMEIESEPEEDGVEGGDSGPIAAQTFYSQLLALFLRLGFDPVKLLKLPAEMPGKNKTRFETELTQQMVDLCLPLVNVLQLYSFDKSRPATVYKRLNRKLELAFGSIPTWDYYPPVFYYLFVLLDSIADEYRAIADELPQGEVMNIADLVANSVQVTMQDEYVLFTKVMLQLGAHWWNTHDLPPALNLRDDAAMAALYSSFLSHGVLESRSQDAYSDFNDAEVIKASTLLSFNTWPEETRIQYIKDHPKDTFFTNDHFLKSESKLHFQETAYRGLDALRLAFDSVEPYSYINLAVQFYQLQTPEDLTLWSTLTELFTAFLSASSDTQLLTWASAFIQQYGQSDVQVLAKESFLAFVETWRRQPAKDHMDSRSDTEHKVIQRCEALLQVDLEKQLHFAALFGAFCSHDATQRAAKDGKADTVSKDLTSVLKNLQKRAIVGLKRDLLLRLADTSAVGAALRGLLDSEQLRLDYTIHETHEIIARESNTILGDYRHVEKVTARNVRAIFKGMLNYPSVHVGLLRSVGTPDDFMASEQSIRLLVNDVHRSIVAKHYNVQLRGDVPLWKLPFLAVDVSSLDALIQAMSSRQLQFDHNDFFDNKGPLLDSDDDDDLDIDEGGGAEVPFPIALDSSASSVESDNEDVNMADVPMEKEEEASSSSSSSDVVIITPIRKEKEPPVKPRKDKGVKRSVIEIISSDEEEIVERDFQRVKKRSKFESLHPTHERFGHPCDICATKLASVIHTTHSIVFCGRACIQEWKADRKKK
jgi:hypothetical protein